MHLYLAIKYHANGQNRALIEALSATLSAAGHRSTCVFRDIEQWGAKELPPAALMRHSFRAIDAADLVLLEFSEKGVGLGIEAGYAHSQGKPVVVIARTGSEISTTLQGIAQQVFFYDTLEDLADLPWPATVAQSTAVAWPYVVRSVERLLDLLEGLSGEALNWRPSPTASSLFALATHIVGNIEETIWGVVCGQPVQRKRDAEFQAVGSDSTAIRERWHQLRTDIDATLVTMNAADLAQPRQHPRRGTMSSNEIFVVVARHAAEHLAQAEMTAEMFHAVSS
ncbi:MAG TPA: DinB family protein [Caldilineaceae bacterium]|nr:DinB family protein [Caldilineaceae bacterium]